MRRAEQVTFGGSGLDRRQALRSDPQALASAWSQALVLTFWRGRPLVTGEAAGVAPVWLPSTHPLAAAAPDPVFLGEDGGHYRFAADVSASLTERHMPRRPVRYRASRHPALPEDQGLPICAVMGWLPPRQAELAVTGKALRNGTGRMASAPAAARAAP